MLKHTLAFFKKLNSLINFPWRTIPFGLGVFILLGLFSSVSSILFDTVGSRAMIYTLDNDASRGIETATKSDWYRSNHFAPYGNLYFRLAHTLAQLAPALTDENATPQERIEVTHHYALMLTSLISSMLLCLFLAKLIIMKWTGTLFLTAVFFNLSLLNPTWITFIFKAHPDHLLMLASAVATYWTLLYFKESSEKNFVISALLWGVVTGIKRTTILLIPSFLFQFLREGLNRESFKKGLKYSGFMLLSYLILGFPQNFGFYKHVKFMMHESVNSVPADLSSVTLLLKELFDQVKFFIPAFVIAHFFLGEKKRILTRDFVIFFIIAIIVYLSRKMMSYGPHHVMPYAGMTLVFLWALISCLPVLNFKNRETIFIIICLLVIGIPDWNKDVIAKEKSQQLSCRKEADDMLHEIKKIQKESQGLLLREPYFPYAPIQDLNKVRWGISFKDIAELKPKLIGLRWYGTMFLSSPPDFFDDVRKVDWDEKQKFYKTVQEGIEFTTPAGERYRMIKTDRCGFQLWERES